MEMWPSKYARKAPLLDFIEQYFSILRALVHNFACAFHSSMTVHWHLGNDGNDEGVVGNYEGILRFLQNRGPNQVLSMLVISMLSVFTLVIGASSAH